MQWKRNKGTFRVYGGRGWKNYEGSHYVCYPFMINRSLNNDHRWALTHIACGREVGNFRTLNVDKECALALQHYDHWFLPTEDLVLKSMKESGEKQEIMEIVQDHRGK